MSKRQGYSFTGGAVSEYGNQDASIDVRQFPLEDWTCESIPRDILIEAVKTAPQLQCSTSRGVARVAFTKVVKYGPAVKMWEAENMKFAATIDGVNVPQLHDAWEEDQHGNGSPRDKSTYILMEYVPGKLLAEIWSTSSNSQQKHYLEKLLTILKSLHGRECEAPGPHGGGKSVGYYFTTRDAGPFNTQLEMELWFDDRLRVCQDYQRAPMNQPSFVEQMGPLVMCHMDLHPHNIILDKQEKLWLIDWEAAGGYPVYFEEAFLETKGIDYQDFQDELVALLHSEEHAFKKLCLDNISFATSTAKSLEPQNPLRHLESAESEPIKTMIGMWHMNRRLEASGVRAQVIN